MWGIHTRQQTRRGMSKLYRFTKANPHIKQQKSRFLMKSRKSRKGRREKG